MVILFFSNERVCVCMYEYMHTFYLRLAEFSSVPNLVIIYIRAPAEMLSIETGEPNLNSTYPGHIPNLLMFIPFTYIRFICRIYLEVVVRFIFFIVFSRFFLLSSSCSSPPSTALFFMPTVIVDDYFHHQRVRGLCFD